VRLHVDKEIQVRCTQKVHIENMSTIRPGGEKRDSTRLEAMHFRYDKKIHK
jgi:hypothetical protein